MARHKKTTDEKYRQTFATRFRELMENAPHVSQAEVASAIGKSRQVVSQYFNGESEPTFETLAKIATFFGVSSDYLIGLSEIKSPSTSTQAATAFTGLSEKNIDFLNVCALAMQYFDEHPVDGITATRSFSEWAEMSGLRKKSSDTLNAKKANPFLYKGKSLADLFDITDPSKYCIFAVYPQIVNDLIDIVQDDVQMVADFISITPTSMLGCAKIASMDNIKCRSTFQGCDPTWEIIKNGMQKITRSDFIRFKANEVGRAIEHHLLEKYGYGND